MIETLKVKGIPIQSSIFAVHIKIQSTNNGPVTLLIDNQPTL